MAEKPPPENTQNPNANSSPGRGWNDPPLLPPSNTMSPSTGAIKKSGLNLNKRVAFPLSGGGSPASSKPVVNSAAPPLMVALPPKLIDTNGTNAESSNNIISSQDEPPDLQATLENFEKVLDSTSKFGAKVNVQVEIQNMKLMWEKEQLNDEICMNIQKLSDALLKKDTKAAQDMLSNISKSLVVRHDTVEWASALRSLVNHFVLSAVYGEATNDNNN
ncbi:uncharacterized protein LOC132202052 [Neocloeon triangulifer]|uniref:uncharacterized protein LOC132202052 n=1 Tax=Neocloeon triangulifer TaxID=2078957 RepID=UPI00286F07AC|nr:uncharacterized protein LOC132202052 [Neocloeon triangulifer]